MATRKRRLSDDELRALCEQEIWQSRGDAGDLAAERTRAMERYLGEPQGDEQEGRSAFVTREVLETIEWVMPSLMRIFSDAENICIFEPQGPEDVDAAQQETDAVEHLFWRQNRGFYNLYAFLKDGLLQKTGILKVWWDESKGAEREEYEGLNEWELAELLADETRSIEIIEWDQDGDGTYSIVLMVESDEGRLHIEPVPPEEFGLDRDARSPYPDDASFIYHRTRKTKSELIECGYDPDVVESLPAANDTLTQERDARRHLSDEQDREQADHWSMERVWVTECYIRVDRDGDGLAELLKVTLAGGDSEYTAGSELLDIEEVDRQPFVTWSPVLLTHKFHGLSASDLVEDLQAIKTTLTRQVLDSTYLANNGRTAVNSRVNLDDLTTSRPGGIVRTKGEDPPGNHMMPIPQQPIPPQTFDLMQYLDDARQRRVGVGEEVGALDGNSLANINTGVAALAYDAARSKIELIARVCAELGLRQLFQRMHELMRKHGTRPLAFRVSGQWAQVRPQEWRERTDMSVQVGIGRISRERRIVALADVLEKQQIAVEGGFMGVVLTPQNVYSAIRDYTREQGLEESLYWSDPDQMEPQEPEPDPQMLALEVQREMTMADAQVRSEKNRVDLAKVQQDGQIKAAELQLRQAELGLREQEAAAKVELLALQSDIKALESERTAADGSAKVAIETEIKLREQELKAAQVAHQADVAAAQREVEVLKAVIQSGTTLSVEQAKLLGMGDDQQGIATQIADLFAEAVAKVSAQVDNLHSVVQAMDEKSRAPRTIKRDANGLIVAIGDIPVERDASGQVTTIG